MALSYTVKNEAVDSHLTASGGHATESRAVGTHCDPSCRDFIAGTNLILDGQMQIRKGGEQT